MSKQDAALCDLSVGHREILQIKIVLKTREQLLF